MIWFIIGFLVIFLIIALAIANYSGSQFLDTYEKYSKIPCYAKVTGGQFAIKVANEVTNGQIRVARTQGYLTDAYSSSAKTVVLSDETCDTASVAALTIVSHEFGHAMQHLSNSKKYRLNTKLLKLTRYLGYFMFPLALVGLFLFFAIPDKTYIGLIVMGASALIFLIAIALKLFSIPLEKDASRRGLKLLQELDVFDDEEMKIAKDLLRAALMTYVGDFLRAILWWTFLTKKTKLF